MDYTKTNGTSVNSHYYTTGSTIYWPPKSVSKEEFDRKIKELEEKIDSAFRYLNKRTYIKSGVLSVFTDESITIPMSKEGRYNLEIKKVIVNPKKDAVTVLFKDGGHEVVKRHLEDPEADIYSIVAYAIAKHVYGSNSHFKKIVDEKTDVLKEKK